MMRRLVFGALLTSLVMLVTAETAEAQFRVRGRGGDARSSYGSPYYGQPYYGPGYYQDGGRYGRGTSISIGVGGPRYYSRGGNYYQPRLMPYDTQTVTTRSSPVTTSSLTGAAYSEPRDGTARIVVMVPPDAELWYNGEASLLRGNVRQLVTLPLAAEGMTYEVKARWRGADGQTLNRSRSVKLMPNKVTTVDFMGKEEGTRSQDDNNIERDNSDNGRDRKRQLDRRDQ